MKKSPDAFRTISEVAAWLDTPAHVLRFWESRFPDLKPVQRAGGRRYYRPDDMLLLGGIKHLLHTEGHTIKSVQDRIAADGASAVTAFSQPLGPVLADGAVTATELQEFSGAASMVDSDTGDAAGHGDTPKAGPEDDAPPIGFFFDDSDDAAPAEAQSGTFAQPQMPDHPAGPSALPEPADPPVVDDPVPLTSTETDTPALVLVPRLGPMPNLPDDPADDATGFGTPLPFSARLRALHCDDVPAVHRDVLTGLFRRLEGWRHASR